MTDWRVTGRYVEACNCEAICPCRRVDGRPGGRAQYQLCQFALAWTIDDGHVGEMDLTGLQAVMAGYWDENEADLPWRVRLYVDGRADDGHDQPGQELVHETLKVEDDPLKFEFHGRCGFAAGFDYRP